MQEILVLSLHWSRPLIQHQFNSLSLSLRKSVSKNMKKKSKSEEKSKRFLVSVNVLGSAGAIRFVVKGDDDAAAVIHTALKIYAREGRLPVLGSDIHTFSLYSAHAGFEALNPSEKIGSRGERNFVLSKRESQPEAINRKGSGWRAWLHKSLSLKILSQ